MFGSSTPGKDSDGSIAANTSSTSNTTNSSSNNSTNTSSGTAPSTSPKDLTLQTDGDASRRSGDKRGSVSNNSSASTPERKSLDETTPTSERKRRSSGIAKAGQLFSNAKHSLHLSSTPHGISSDSLQSPQQTPMQKLGKTDAVLSVPQGSLNNSAGESKPGPRSTFRVGVTEDKNRKCRRTMEDTHAYLYNFLSTPAPAINNSSESSSEPLESPLSEEVPIASRVVETDNGYFAIFDGHAGTFAADWCGKKLHVLLEEIIRKNPNSPIPELLDQTFTSVDQQLDKLPLKNSGCTAICAVLRWEDRIPNSQSATGSTAIAPAAAAVVKAVDPNNTNGPVDPPNLGPQMNAVISESSPITALPRLQEKATRQRVLYTANVGDARIVLCRNGKALRLSYDHKGSDENEGKRITNAGGLILNNRVNGVLAVTRALGDAYMKDLVTGHPYTTETVIQADIDEFLILACDGLWDVCSDQEAVDLIRHTVDPQVASKQLVDYALGRFSTDNLSCMVVRFDNKLLQQTVERGKTDPIGVEGDPPTTKKGGISEIDGIVREARKSLIAKGGIVGNDSSAGGGIASSTGMGGAEEGANEGVLGEVIREEEGKESGPELKLEGAKHLRGQKSTNG
ncbi:Protein phosphatase 2C 1 [Agyrium rufum]|nr:Protein phosphatase 2C 1 [Agyrium rufum]